MRRLAQLLLSSLRSCGPGLRGPLLRPCVAGAVGGALLGGLAGFHAPERPRLRLSAVQAARVEEPKGPPGPGNVNFIADVVEKVLPAVVFIERGTEKRFGLPTGAGSGSGFIIREDGLIVTNGHVVGNSRRVRVTLANGERLEGRVLAVDPDVDVALVSVSAAGLKRLPTMAVGQSDRLRTGEWVVALGSPRFLTNSVTVGVVSAKERDLGHQRGMRYIQTDAVITHGNSGGPLVNVAGEVVGVNTLKLEAGIGFAVPADVVTRFVADALDRLRFDRAAEHRPGPGPGRRQRYIGISMVTLGPELLRDLHLMRPGLFDGVGHGVFVHSVHGGSPAERAGLRPNDVIVAIGGQEVRDAKEVYRIVNDQAGAEPAAVLSVSVMRGGQRVDLSVRPEFVDEQ